MLGACVLGCKVSPASAREFVTLTQAEEASQDRSTFIQPLALGIVVDQADVAGQQDAAHQFVVGGQQIHRFECQRRRQIQRECHGLHGQVLANGQHGGQCSHDFIQPVIDVLHFLFGGVDLFFYKKEEPVRIRIVLFAATFDAIEDVGKATQADHPGLAFGALTTKPEP
ncbi:hypothetical protein ALP36_200097 [Pseudomonas syringae pv. coriandricola]|uniref:Uncharacterized protein n=1 Tax=Pseudomonas syringae pv. coriandricola TaxID=264453 RepID=A0A3M5R157_9PSED|nr:hypothetical protein ALP36_200097 [Pseudomonas syringae pv. coriandricola]